MPGLRRGLHDSPGHSGGKISGFSGVNYDSSRNTKAIAKIVWLTWAILWEGFLRGGSTRCGRHGPSWNNPKDTLSGLVGWFREPVLEDSHGGRSTGCRRARGQFM